MVKHDSLPANPPTQGPNRSVAGGYKRPANITQAAIKRTIKGALTAGFDITRIEIEGGKLVLYGKADDGDGLASPLNLWRRSNGSR